MGVGRAREVRGGAVRQARAKGKAGNCYSQGRGLLRSHGGRVAGSQEPGSEAAGRVAGLPGRSWEVGGRGCQDRAGGQVAAP